MFNNNNKIKMKKLKPNICLNKIIKKIIHKFKIRNKINAIKIIILIKHS